ncbi:MAG: tagaturonate epimerase family protein, partial [Firmicutes bacterium]|nr:tagaturonate epimerase family protein [Bacillota bacterium]
LPGLLEDEPSRQLLHITYGQIIQDPALGPALFRLLAAEEEAYYEAVIAHFRRHLEALGLSE